MAVTTKATLPVSLAYFHVTAWVVPNRQDSYVSRLLSEENEPLCIWPTGSSARHPGSICLGHTNGVLYLALPWGLRLNNVRVEYEMLISDNDNDVTTPKTYGVVLALASSLTTPPSPPRKVGVTGSGTGTRTLSWQLGSATEYVVAPVLLRDDSVTGTLVPVPLSDITRAGVAMTATFSSSDYDSAQDVTNFRLTLVNGSAPIFAEFTHRTNYDFPVASQYTAPTSTVTIAPVATATKPFGGSIVEITNGTSDTLSVLLTGVGVRGASAVTVAPGGSSVASYYVTRPGVVTVGASATPAALVASFVSSEVGALDCTLTADVSAVLVGDAVTLRLSLPAVSGGVSVGVEGSIRAYNVEGDFAVTDAFSWMPDSGLSKSFVWTPSEPGTAYFEVLLDDVVVGSGMTVAVSVPGLRMWVDRGVCSLGQPIVVSAAYTSAKVVGGSWTVAADASGTWGAQTGDFDTALGIARRTFTPTGTGKTTVTFSGSGTGGNGKTNAAAASGPMWSSTVLLAGTSGAPVS